MLHNSYIFDDDYIECIAFYKVAGLIDNGEETDEIDVINFLFFYLLLFYCYLLSEDIFYSSFFRLVYF